MIKEYRRLIAKFSDILAEEKLKNESYNGTWLVEGKITFITDWTLEFMEFKSENKHKYRFHLMDENKKLITRWDTAPHHPELENHPFHKHTSKNVVPTEEKDGTEILTHYFHLVLENI